MGLQNQRAIVGDVELFFNKTTKKDTLNKILQEFQKKVDAIPTDPEDGGEPAAEIVGTAETRDDPGDTQALATLEQEDPEDSIMPDCVDPEV